MDAPVGGAEKTKKMNYINVISLGAGKQSSYMLLQSLEGKFEYRPDYAIFSDTGCEPKYVYEYLFWLKDYVFNKYGFEIKIVSKSNLLKDVERYIDGEINRVSQLPFFLENGGIVMRQCTVDYKIAPLRKYLQKIRNNNKVRLWIGISLDEMERMKNSPVGYIEHYYPLIENKISIDNIVNWFNNSNLPIPGKSACLICPFHSTEYWQRFKKEFPEEFETACLFDEKIRNYPKLNKKAFIYRKSIPLRDVNFTFEQSLFPELIEECNGLCGL